MLTPYYSTRVLEEKVLRRANAEELLALTQIFDSKAIAPKGAAPLVVDICKAGGHAIANFVRSAGVPYSELLHDVAKQLKVDGLEPIYKVTATGLTVTEMDARVLNDIVDRDIARGWNEPLDVYLRKHEQAVVKTFIKDSYDRMSPEQRVIVDSKVKELGGNRTSGLGAAAAVLVVANAGGFTTYMLMSTVISALTFGGASFSAYTAAASAMHFLIGPVGWAALGVTAVYKLGGPNHQRCVKSVMAVAMIRARLAQ